MVVFDVAAAEGSSRRRNKARRMSGPAGKGRISARNDCPQSAAVIEPSSRNPLAPNAPTGIDAARG
jgi:hypothetical protein